MDIRNGWSRSPGIWRWTGSRKIDREALVDEIPETGQSGSMEEQVVNSVSLKVAMESLKPDEREIVDMKVAGGFTFREIFRDSWQADGNSHVALQQCDQET